MWKWTSTSRSVLVHFHIVESGKLESLENTPLLLQPWYTVLSRLQQEKTKIGQLNLCRIKLPYRQRQQERASRVRQDHKLALRTAFAALFLVTTSVFQRRGNDLAAGGEKDCDHMQARLCWNDHAEKSEREGTFQRKYRMKRRTFEKLVALLRPALERDYCKNSVLAVS